MLEDTNSLDAPHIKMFLCFFFCQNPASESVKCALHLLTTSAVRLQEECHECDDTPLDSEEMTFDPALKTQQVIQCAYDIAKSAKQLVTLFQWFLTLVDHRIS